MKVHYNIMYYVGCTVMLFVLTCGNSVSRASVTLFIGLALYHQVEKYPELTYDIGGDEHGILKPDGGLKVCDMRMHI